MLDAGAVGLILFVATVARAMYVLRREAIDGGASVAVGLVAALIVIVLSGATEVSATYYADESLLMIMLIVGAAAGLERRIPPGPPVVRRRSTRPVRPPAAPRQPSLARR